MELPLFPLPNLVLFPYVVVPLHIFEERYKLMINQCLSSSEPFGLVLLREDASSETEDTIHHVGVMARVIQVERLEDGRMNILSAGESRFRIARFTGNTPYWTALVDVLEDDEEPLDTLESLSQELTRLYKHSNELASQLRSIEGELTLPESPLALSYVVSYVSDLDTGTKQQLLEMTSTEYRLSFLVEHLQKTIQQLEQQIARKNVAGKVQRNGDLGLPGKKS